MLVWFGALTVSGIISISTLPSIISAVSPHHAIKFMINNGMSAFLSFPRLFYVLRVVKRFTPTWAILVASRSRGPGIWYLCAGYKLSGQGAFIMTHSDATNILFGMVQSQSAVLYIPFLVLTIMATVIASQALISGVYSIVYQGITTRMLPLLKIEYTSAFSSHRSISEQSTG